MSGVVFNKDIYIIEGFDMVGKSTFIEKYMDKFNLYYPTHDLTDKTIGRNNSWVIGYSVIDYLKQLSERPRTVISRGVMSGQVYSRIYGNKFLDNCIIDYFKNDEFFCKEIGHIYLRHRDVESAKKMFEASKSREKNSNEVSAKLDNFRTFDYYWTYYTNADLIFNDMYSKFGIEPRIFEVDFENKDFNEVL